jgi:hypothetical protein
MLPLYCSVAGGDRRLQQYVEEVCTTVGMEGFLAPLTALLAT